MNLFTILCNLLIPVIMIIGGVLMMKNPPRDRSQKLGIRTKWAMKSEETWKFTHEHSGKLWTKYGIALFIITLIPSILSVKGGEQLMGLVAIGLTLIQCAVLYFAISQTHKAVMENFDEKGRRKRRA